MHKDFYQTLGVKKDADKAEIKKAYYKKSQKHHPDKKGGNQERFQEVALAYEVLSDNEKRGKYDRGEPIFDTQDPEAFIRSRALQLFEQQINNPRLDFRHSDIFKPIIQQCKTLINQLPQAKQNALDHITKYKEIKERISGENSEIYINSLNSKIQNFERMVKGMPEEIKKLEKIIEYVEKTEYKTDEKPQQRDLHTTIRFAMGGDSTNSGW